MSAASDYFEILTATGDPIMKEAWPGMDDFAVHTNTHLIHRGDFIDALVGVLPDGMVESVTSSSRSTTRVTGPC